jgi:hypothetical protein
MRRLSVWGPACALLAAVVVAGCTRASAPASSEGQAPAAAPEPRTVADIFPAGAGKDAVLNSCGSCHNVACSAIGQRTNERWDSLKASHKDNVPGADLDAIFGYLKANFNDSRPQPNIPPHFLEGGCTPF